MSKLSAKYRLKIAKKTDERIRSMNEIITGIQIIKMYSWENPFIKLIESIREKEMVLIKIGNYLEAVNISLEFCVDRTAIFLCILTYVLTGNVPNAQYVYIVSAFYKMLMSTLSVSLPEAVARLLQANVSIKRFEDFLSLNEITLVPPISNKIGIEMTQASAKWTQFSQTLSQIDFEAKPQELVAIIGPVGSGKTSLLNVFLNELSLEEGKLEIGGTVSYATQEPWLFSGTIRQNILFGLAMKPKRYNEVLRICALESDLARLPYLDNTIVGERGILLSGGQKARINLARAVYREADIYLLDDPLAAVDASVGKQIFENCISGYLKNKCTVLVTHQVQYLASADRIYLLENGKVVISGSYENLKTSGENFTKLLNSIETPAKESQENSIIKETDTKIEEQEVEMEHKASGKVSTKVYSKYWTSGGTPCVLFVIVLLFIMTELCATGANYFVTFW